jgi:hypothetical protein
MKSIKILLTIFTLLFLSNCQKSSEEPSLRDLGLDFFPLQENLFWEYDITEITYTVLNPPATNTYQIREEIKELFIGLDNQLAYRYEKYKRNNDNESWQIDSTGFVQKTNFNVKKSVNNLIFTKLAFPLEEGKQWNGNAYNHLGATQFTLQNVRQKYTTNTQLYPQTATVFQINDSSLVALNRRFEVYAEDIGLIEANYKSLNYCTTANCVGQGVIHFGNEYKQRLKRYGKM